MTSTTPARSSDFLSTIGVNTHIPYTDGGYADIGKVIADLQYLGITQTRDFISDGVIGAAPLSSYVTLAKQGVKFTFYVDGGVKDLAGLKTRIGLIQQLAQAVPGSVVAVEGPNEVNNWPVTYNGTTGLAGALALQKDLYSLVHGNAALSGVAVDYFTGYGAGGVANGPDPSKVAGLADYNTQHPYPQNGSAPAAWVDPATTLTNQAPGAAGPFVYTEAGYSSNGGVWSNVDLSVQARYTLDLLFDAMQAGAAHTDLYELMDAYAAGSPQGNSGFGLFDSAGKPKPVATAIHNLTTILADTGATASTFTPAPFAATVTGLPASGRQMVLEKSSGAADLVLWAEPKIWDPATGREVVPSKGS